MTAPTSPVYVPWIDWLLLVAVLTLVFAFRTSAALHALNEHVVILSLETLTVPHDGIAHATACFGDMDQPNVPDVVRQIEKARITADAAEYFGLPRDRTVILGSRIEV